MNRDNIYNAVVEYLDLIENGKASTEENLQALELSLDKLALARNIIDYEYDDTNYPDVPKESYDRLRKLACIRFPDFGFYNRPEYMTTKIAETTICVGDAIDDIADIALDMHDIAWYWKHTSPEKALWHFEFGYDAHWGEHLRYLQLYILASKRDL